MDLPRKYRLDVHSRWHSWPLYVTIYWYRGSTVSASVIIIQLNLWCSSSPTFPVVPLFMHWWFHQFRHGFNHLSLDLLRVWVPFLYKFLATSYNSRRPLQWRFLVTSYMAYSTCRLGVWRVPDVQDTSSQVGDVFMGESLNKLEAVICLRKCVNNVSISIVNWLLV